MNIKSTMFCEICDKERKDRYYVIFIPHPIHSIGIPLGYNIFVCQECYMSYLSQFLKMSNREITIYFKWMEGI